MKSPEKDPAWPLAGVIWWLVWLEESRRIGGR